MSEGDFMRHGIGRLVLVDNAAPPYPDPWWIRVYEIGEEGLVGVIYPDSRQVHSRSWWAAKLAKAGPLPEWAVKAEQAREEERLSVAAEQEQSSPVRKRVLVRKPETAKPEPQNKESAVPDWLGKIKKKAVEEVPQEPLRKRVLVKKREPEPEPEAPPKIQRRQLIRRG